MTELTLEQLTDKKQFYTLVEITRNIIFEISFINDGTANHFTTSAAKLNKPKSDYSECGQAQESLLPTNSPAMKFFTKWDVEHLNDLSSKKYDELVNDINQLSLHYNIIIFDEEIPFNKVVEFSKIPIKLKPKIIKIA